jgi:hypothetical protein
LIGLFGVPLVGFMTADDASGNYADLAVPRDMAREAPNDGAFNATLRLGGGGREYHAKNDASGDQRLHGVPPKKPVACNNPGRAD